ncbi:MAG TPA: ABC transporter permease subunit [Micromonosporaceae bacterium]|nr:ABC transporter permease subunit [Micromonosporaceae bacterium]
MTATIIESAAAPGTADRKAPARRTPEGYRVTLPRVIRSEWIKLRSLRSTVYTLLAAVGIMLGFGALFAYLTTTGEADGGPGPQGVFDATATSLGGVNLAQLAIGVLGVLLVTGEYSTGMIRASLAAVPQRLPVLWAKLAVFTAIATATMVAASLAAFLIGQAILSGEGTQTDLGEPGVARAVVGAGLYLAGVGVLGVALGSVLRSTAGAIATLFGVLLVLPIFGQLLPASFADAMQYLPSNAGQAVMAVQQGADSLAPWTGFGVFATYLAAAIVAAAVLLQRRDA